MIVNLAAERKSLPPELSGIIQQLLGHAIWAASAICVASLIILSVLAGWTHLTSTHRLDKVVNGMVMVLVAAGVLGVGSAYVNWLLGA